MQAQVEELMPGLFALPETEEPKPLFITMVEEKSLMAVDISSILQRSLPGSLGLNLSFEIVGLFWVPSLHTLVFRDQLWITWEALGHLRFKRWWLHA